MSKHAIVLYYDGLKPAESFVVNIVERLSVACNAESNSIVVKHYDESDIIKAAGNDAIRKIVFNNEDKKEQNIETVKICFNPGPSKLTVVKLIKDTFGCSLKQARDYVDGGVIMAPQTASIYQFVRDLSAIGGCIVDGSDVHYAVAQAAIFINNKYPGNLQAENLVKDFAMARYHDYVNAADDIEKALLNTVQIVKEYSHIAQQWINPDLVKTITML